MSDLYVNSILREFQDGKEKNAFEKLSKYITENPRNFTAIYNYALMAENLNQNQVAIQNYEKVIRFDKNNWRSRFNLYLIYIKQNNYDKALVLINAVLKLQTWTIF